MESAQQPILSEEEREMFKGYDFHFENLVMEGGGAKLFGGVGTVRVLEELEVLQKMKRFGGTSAGSLLVTLIALGYEGHEIEKHMAVDIKAMIEDEYSLVKYPTQLYNLVNSYGLHYGTTLKKWLGKLIAKKLDGNQDATFWELYKKEFKNGRREIELVITATELMHKETVYFHVKTTPDRPIREAVIMSMSIPGIFRPTLDADAVFVDGGVFNNYPIHCFDGWFLSHGEENDFIKKHIETRKKDKYFWREFRRFEGRNDKTIGLIVYSTMEDEKLKDELEDRNKKYIRDIHENTLGLEKTTVPETELRRSKKNPIKEKYRTRLDAQLRFQQAIAERAGHTQRLADDGDEDEKYQIPSKKVKSDMSSQFDDEDAELLFDRGVDAETAIKTHMTKLNAHDDADGKVKHLPFDRRMVVKSSTGLELIRHTKCNSEHFAPRRLDKVEDFLMSLADAYGYQMMMKNSRSKDCDRTIGVDVAYITTADYKMEDEDRSFLLQQSKIACLAFLHEYIKKQTDKDDH